MEEQIYSPLSQKLTSECEMETKKKERREAEKQLSRWTAEFAFRFLRFYFCTCTFEYYQLQLKYPPRIPEVLLYKDIKSVTLHQGGVVVKAGHGPCLLSLLPSSN